MHSHQDGLLPEEVWTRIFTLLSFKDLQIVKLVSHFLFQVSKMAFAQKQDVWKTQLQKDYPLYAELLEASPRKNIRYEDEYQDIQEEFELKCKLHKTEHLIPLIRENNSDEFKKNLREEPLEFRISRVNSNLLCA